MKVAILTEGDNKKGIGHITRCYAIFQCFLQHLIPAHLYINGNNKLMTFLDDTNINYFNWLENFENFKKNLYNFDVVIIDSYIADWEIYDQISQNISVAIYIDDFKRLNYPKGIILNWQINAKKLNYPVNKDILHLLGPRYSILRKPFWNKSKKIIRQKIQTILITIGGSDKRGFTSHILKTINKNFPNFDKRVIIGQAFNNIENIYDEKDEKTIILDKLNAERMKQEMLSADLVITACGQTLYELAAVGVPAIGIAFAKNQLNNVKGWKEVGYLDYAGWWEESNILQKVVIEIKKLQDYEKRVRMSQIGQDFINPLGTFALIEFIKRNYNF